MTPQHRLDNPKQETRRIRHTGTAVAAAAAAILAGCAGLSVTRRAAKSTPDIVTATAFRLVDTAGATRAVLAMEQGDPVLRFLGEDGAFRASIGLHERGPFLFFAREQGKPGTSIGVGGKGPSIALADTAGHLRILLTVADSTGMPTIRLRDTTGHVTWSVPETEEE
ncbi:hypothetical protein JXD38_04955 [candidate division WOR-3 bacterium]|nr:hypothetical protein [candidate division WOR-3 bacterium]